MQIMVDMAERRRIEIGATGLGGLEQEIRMVLATRIAPRRIRLVAMRVGGRHSPLIANMPSYLKFVEVEARNSYKSCA